MDTESGEFRIESSSARTGSLLNRSESDSCGLSELELCARKCPARASSRATTMIPKRVKCSGGLLINARSLPGLHSGRRIIDDVGFLSFFVEVFGYDPSHFPSAVGSFCAVVSVLSGGLRILSRLA
jgi:hypothetical protein